MNSIDHYHFLMSSNGGHSVTFIKYPDCLDPATVKKGDTVICWDDCELAENPRLAKVPKTGMSYKVREVNPETFGLRLQNLKNPKGNLPVEPGFHLTRFCTKEEWKSAPLEMVKNMPHTKVKFCPLGFLKEVFYATSYTVSFDNFFIENRNLILEDRTPFTALRYTFGELMLNQDIEAYSEFSVVQSDGCHFLVKRTRVETEDIIGENIDNTRIVIMLKDVQGISFINHAKAMLLLWVLYDRLNSKNLDEQVTSIGHIDIDTAEDLLIEKKEIEDLFDFTHERTIHEKVCGLLQIVL
jgi:hypothetical protein